MTPKRKVRGKKLPAYALYQEGVMVTFVEANTWKEAKKEIDHYAMMYGQDGPVEIVKVGGKSKGRVRK